MEDFPSDRDARESLSPDSPTAAQLLSQAERVSARVVTQTDFRANAAIQGWVAAALFVYVATFLVLFSSPRTSEAVPSPGSSYVFVLLIPFLLLSQLVQGARNRLPIMSSFPQRRASTLLVFLPGPAVFFAATAAYSAGVRLPWWVSILAAFAAAVPLAVLALVSATQAQVSDSPRTTEALTLQPLSRTAAGMTAGLGIYFGVLAAVTPYWWFPVASMFLTLVLMVSLIGGTAKWGLPSVGSQWGTRHWAAFGITFTLLFAIAIMAARTLWNTPLIGTLSGIAVAAPLLLSSMKRRRHQ